MRSFDLEAAKRGEPIVRYLPSSGETHDVVFLGVRLNGNIVVEYLSGSLVCYRPDELRMKPQKRTVHLIAKRGADYGTWHSNKFMADKAARELNAACDDAQLYKAVPVEIEL